MTCVREFMDELTAEIKADIKQLHGPILILGASGFIGANLFRIINAVRSDVYGTSTQKPVWRLENFPASQIIQFDVLLNNNTKNLLNKIMPATIFDCIAYGSYSFEQEQEKIYRTNLFAKISLIEEIIKRGIYCYIHAGSSSEYGIYADKPAENVILTPNSHYSVTKCAMSQIIYYAGKHQGLRAANLRLYSAYGPWEDSARFIPTLIAHCLKGQLPPLVKPETSRDFIFVTDVCHAFITAANKLSPTHYGESFNIGTGFKTTIHEVVQLACDIFNVKEKPNYSSMPSRGWDTENWQANPEKANTILNWQSQISLREGLLKTAEWFKQIADEKKYLTLSKQNSVETKCSISAIVACYKDELAIPLMVKRLVAVFEKLHIDYEIILVNDGSPDSSENVIKQLSSENFRILGITHTRNFGSQAAFQSGMEIASKEACVLLDGDLQDPPELIEQFITKWREGYDVVYGIRVKREASLLMQLAYKLFYRIFDQLSAVAIPHDAGDFSLIDKRVVLWLLTCKERDLFLRGLRAYVGFKQTGIDYVRPERLFGKTTNSLLKNIDWAKKGIFSFSKTPLNILTSAGTILVAITLLLALFQIVMRIFFPESAPKGVTTLILLIMFFGSFTILAISLIGEYIAKIFEEVKARPPYIRKNLIKEGTIFTCDGNDSAR